MWPGAAAALPSARRLEIYLQVKGAGDGLMVTDGVHHVADVAPQEQGEGG